MSDTSTSHSDDLSTLASDEYFASRPRLSLLAQSYSIYLQDIMQIKLAATQLVYNVLDESIRICMVFYGKDPPLPSQLLLYDPADHNDRIAYASRDFDAVVREKIEHLLGKFIRQWVHRRRRLRFALKVLRHWTVRRAREKPQEARLVPNVRYEDQKKDSDGNVVPQMVGRLDRKWLSNEIVEHSYVYEAKFSYPTRQCPTPQCTANVFFWFDVTEFDADTVRSAIYVPYTYQFEGLVYRYKPSTHNHSFDFQEDILLGIMDNKRRMYARLDF